ncbi:MAG TPA: amidase [Actinomycetota bacterium]|nr:amidase [Actinomycetota bacterium]
MTELSDLDATAQAQLVRDGEVSPAELVEDAIARIEKLNPELNAVIHPMFDQARAAARAELPDGPFRGVPMVLKDLDGSIAGEPFHCGNKLMKEVDFRPHHDSFSHKKLRDAGFVFVGKTNCPEFGFVPTTEPKAYGATRNPWDPSRSTGGSSGGTAAAVASRMVAVGSAGDGGGSIRIPASECGLVGLKPSRGRVSLGPELGEAWHGLVVRGGLSRTVRDSAGVLDVMSGEVPGDPYVAPPFSRPLTDEVGADPGKLRIGFTTRAFADMAVTEDVCVRAVQDAATLLGSLGHEVEEDSPASLNDTDVISHGVTIIAAWARWELDSWGRVIGRTFGPDDVEEGTWQFAELAGQVTGTEYIKAIEAIHARSRDTADWWAGGFDLLLTPTIPQPPPPLGSWEPTEENPMQGLAMSTQMVSFVAAFNLTGQPAISLPLFQSEDGLPIGIQLVAPYGREDLLVRIASQLEAERSWIDRRPPLS